MAGYIGNSTQNSILVLLFNATTFANYAVNATASPFTTIGVSLQTADPGAGGTMSTSEVTYTSYARQTPARTSAGWAVSGSSPTTVNPVATIGFPAGTGGSGTVTNFTVGSPSGGAVNFLYAGTVTPNIVTGNGITPQLTTATALTLD